MKNNNIENVKNNKIESENEIMKNVKIENENVNVNIESEERIMKKLSLKELSEIVNVKESSLRYYIMKCEEGQVYSKSNINYKELYKGLKNRFGNEFESKFGFKIEDIEIVKKEKNEYDYVNVNDLEIGKKYLIKNYSLEYDVELRSIVNVDDEVCYIFRKDGMYLKMFEKSELERENIKIIEK